MSVTSPSRKKITFIGPQVSFYYIDVAMSRTNGMEPRFSRKKNKLFSKMHFLQSWMSKPESLSSPNTSDSLFILKRQFESSKQSYYVIPHYISKIQPEKAGTSATYLLTDIQGNTYCHSRFGNMIHPLKNEDFIEDLFGFSDV